MITPVHIPEAFAVDMRINLRGADIGMSEQLLDGTDIGSALEHVGRETVPQDMRGNPLRGYTGRQRPLFDYLENPLPGEWLAEPRQKNARPRKTASGKSAAGRVEIRRQRGAGRAAYRHEPLLGTFAENPQQFTVGHDIAAFQSADFADSEPAPVKNLQHRPIAQFPGRIAVHAVYDPEHLAFIEHFGQSARFAGRMHPFGGIFRDQPAIFQILKPTADRDRPPRTRRTRQSVLALMTEKSGDVIASDILRRTASARGKPRREYPEVTPVGRAGIGGKTALERQRVDIERYLVGDHNREMKSSMNSAINGFAAAPAATTSSWQSG